MIEKILKCISDNSNHDIETVEMTYDLNDQSLDKTINVLSLATFFNISPNDARKKIYGH